MTRCVLVVLDAHRSQNDINMTMHTLFLSNRGGSACLLYLTVPKPTYSQHHIAPASDVSFLTRHFRSPTRVSVPWHLNAHKQENCAWWEWFFIRVSCIVALCVSRNTTLYAYRACWNCVERCWLIFVIPDTVTISKVLIIPRAIRRQTHTHKHNTAQNPVFIVFATLNNRKVGKRSSQTYIIEPYSSSIDV